MRSTKQETVVLLGGDDSLFSNDSSDANRNTFFAALKNSPQFANTEIIPFATSIEKQAFLRKQAALKKTEIKYERAVFPLSPFFETCFGRDVKAVLEQGAEPGSYKGLVKTFRNGQTQKNQRDNIYVAGRGDQLLYALYQQFREGKKTVYIFDHKLAVMQMLDRIIKSGLFEGMNIIGVQISQNGVHEQSFYDKHFQKTESSVTYIHEETYGNHMSKQYIPRYSWLPKPKSGYGRQGVSLPYQYKRFNGIQKFFDAVKRWFRRFQSDAVEKQFLKTDRYKAFEQRRVAQQQQDETPQPAAAPASAPAPAPVPNPELAPAPAVVQAENTYTVIIELPGGDSETREEVPQSLLTAMNMVERACWKPGYQGSKKRDESPHYKFSTHTAREDFNWLEQSQKPHLLGPIIVSLRGYDYKGKTAKLLTDAEKELVNRLLQPENEGALFYVKSFLEDYPLIEKEAFVQAINQGLDRKVNFQPVYQEFFRRREAWNSKRKESERDQTWNPRDEALEAFLTALRDGISKDAVSASVIAGGGGLTSSGGAAAAADTVSLRNA